MLLGFRRDGDAFAGEDRSHPFGRPAALGRCVDRGERLQGDRCRAVVGERAAEIMPVATHGNRRRADGAAEVEGEDLDHGVAAELQRHQRQQHRLAGTGRPDDQGVADVADMEREPERGRAVGLGDRTAGVHRDARPVPAPPIPLTAESCGRD